MTKVVSAVLESKTFSFDAEELELKGINLVESNLFQKVGKHFRVRANSDFTKKIVLRLELQFCPSYNSDFRSFYNFYQQIDQYFEVSGSNSQGRSSHIEAILQCLILKANKEFGIQFDSFIPKLWTEIDSFESFQLNSAFSKILGQLIIHPRKLHISLLHLYDNTAGDGGVNMDRGIITGGIQDYCENNHEEGKVLLELYEDGSGELIISHHAAALAGLYRYDEEQGIKRLGSYARIKEFQESVAAAIAVIEPNSCAKIESLLSVMDSMNWRLEPIMSYIPRAIVNFLNSEFTLAPELADSCFDKLGLVILSGNTHLSNNALFHLQFLKGYKSRVFDLLQLLASEEVELQYVSKQVDNLLRRLDCNDYLFNFIRLINIRSMNEFRSDILEFSLDHFMRKHEREFSKELIALLIDDDGMNRWKAQKIYSHFAITSLSSFLFKTDLTQLSALDQYKLLVSVLADFMEPRYCLASILPLRKTNYPLVFEILVSKIESLIENFSSSVLRECQKHLDPKSDLDKRIIERVKLEVEHFDQYCEIKTDIAEFNPMSTKTSIYKEYTAVISDRMAEISQAAEKNRDSFLDYFQTVRLAKGGRWIGIEDNRRTELNQFRSSFQLPRDCYRIPQRFELEIVKGYSEDWSVIFKPWEQIISS